MVYIRNATHTLVLIVLQSKICNKLIIFIKDGIHVSRISVFMISTRDTKQETSAKMHHISYYSMPT